MSSGAEDRPSKKENLIVLILFLCQLINILEFMMVMPLGPDFAKDLSIDLSQLGLIGSSYTFAAAVAGIFGSVYFDRFDRKKILAFSILGLSVSTFLVTLASNLPTLLGARVFAGLMGGPASSIVMAIVADVIPPQRRGRAMGFVMGAFAIASVLGVPFGLELALRGGWTIPFYVLSAIALIIFIAIQVWFPSMTTHLQAAARQNPQAGQGGMVMFRNVAVVLSLLAVPTLFAGNFMLIPNISSYVQFNLGFPRANMSSLYFFGGIAALFTTQLGGRFVDRYGAIAVNIVGTVIVGTAMVLGFMVEPAMLPVHVIFVCFMAGTSLRNVAFFTLSSKVPGPSYRASYMSVQSAVNHFSIAAGAFVASLMLTEAPDHKLIGMSGVTVVALLISLATPPLLSRIKRQLEGKTSEAHSGRVSTEVA